MNPNNVEQERVRLLKECAELKKLKGKHYIRALQNLQNMCAERGVKESLKLEMISKLNHSDGHQELNALKWLYIVSKKQLDNFIEVKLRELNVSPEVFTKFDFNFKSWIVLDTILVETMNSNDANTTIQQERVRLQKECAVLQKQKGTHYSHAQQNIHRMCAEMNVNEKLKHKIISLLNKSQHGQHQELNALKWFCLVLKFHLEHFIEGKLRELNVPPEVFAKFDFNFKSEI